MKCALVGLILRGSHILLGKAGQIGDGVPRKQPGKHEIQYNDGEETYHRCQDVLSVSSHDDMLLAGLIYFAVMENQLLALLRPKV